MRWSLLKRRRSRQHQPPKDCVKVLRPKMYVPQAMKGPTTVRVHATPFHPYEVGATRFCPTQHDVVTAPKARFGPGITVIQYKSIYPDSGYQVRQLSGTA